jgi:Cu(I)/Ag(I) efflux system membrane fusion protein
MSKYIVIAIILLGLGAGLGYMVAMKLVPGKIESMQSMANAPAEKSEPLFYRSPMDPAITSPVPAKDAMGMDYVPVYAETGSSKKDPSGTVRIDSVMVQNIGVRTAVAKITSLSRSIRAVGRVDYNEERMARLHPKTEGWIEKLFVDKTGEQVKSGTILLGIYSPQLVTSQQEYLLALNNLKTLENSTDEDVRIGAKNLLKSSLERLRLLDVPPHQVRELEEARKVKKILHIHSPFAGVVTNIGARQGQYVTPKTELYMIADLSKVWVYANIYEYELPWVSLGDQVEMTLAAIPGKVFKGQVSYIYPYAEAKTRTIKVRLIFDNPKRLLKPEMFADVTIAAKPQEHVVVIPSEAIVRSGKTEQVFVVSSPGKFEPRQVTLGMESNGNIIILSGLKEGETVVTSAQFLIDSESKLREATAKMMESLNQRREQSETDSGAAK